MYRPSALKQKLAACRKTFGCWTVVGSAVSFKILGLDGCGILLIDQEHGPGGPTTLVGQPEATDTTPVASVMRVPLNGLFYLKFRP